jgi:hypothetical protein
MPPMLFKKIGMEMLCLRSSATLTTHGERRNFAK